MPAKASALVKESKAIEAVKRFEKRNGRSAVRSKQGTGYDLLSSPRKIEVKTISRVQNGFVQLNARQFQVMCAEKDYWVYLVVLGPRPLIFPFRRNQILPFIRTYVHFDFFYKKRFLARSKDAVVGKQG